LPSYRFTYPYTKFYPDVRDAEGKSLMAQPGDVVVFDAPPDDGSWLLVEDAPEVPVPAPVVMREAPQPEPVPVVTEPAPEPAPVITEPAEAVIPEPVPLKAATPPPFPFPGFYVSPYAR